MKHCYKLHNETFKNCKGYTRLNRIKNLNKIEKDMKKYKISIFTDGDLDKGELKPFFKETGFEEWESEYLPADIFLPLLLATILISIKLPKYSNEPEYNIKKLFLFTKDLFEQKKYIFNTNRKYIDNVLNKHKIIRKVFKENNNNYQELLKKIKIYSRRIIDDYNDNDFISYDLGNREINILEEK